MKIQWIAASLFSLLPICTTSVSAQTAEDAFGTWKHPDNGSTVEMAKCGDGLCAKIVSITDDQKTDDKNPDPAHQKDPVVGLVIMKDAKKATANSWTGQLYNRANGGTYAGTLTVKSKDAIELSGCKAIVFCKTVTWTRAKDAAPAAVKP